MKRGLKQVLRDGKAGSHMTRQPTAMMLAFLVVITTWSWAQRASAALIFDSPAVSQPPWGRATSESSGANPIDRQPPWAEQEPGRGPPADGLRPRQGATAPSSSSSGFSGDMVSAGDAAFVFRVPPPVARVMIRLDLIWPDPAPVRLFRPPRYALVLA